MPSASSGVIRSPPGLPLPPIVTTTIIFAPGLAIARTQSQWPAHLTSIFTRLTVTMPTSRDSIAPGALSGLSVPVFRSKFVFMSRVVVYLIPLVG